MKQQGIYGCLHLVVFAAKLILSMMSKARNSESVNAKHFATIPTATLALQTAVYNYSRAKPNIKIRTINGQKHYFVQPTVQPKLKDVDIDLYLRQRDKLGWRTFGTYRKYQNRIWLVLMSDNWEDVSCTCASFLKKYV
jgi:hypothetical protein